MDVKRTDNGMSEIQRELFALRDMKYRSFQAKLIPNIDPARIIGIRTPELRALAKRIKARPETAAFLGQLPHAYFDEDQLHAFLISEEKDFEKCVDLTEKFLPHVDNWATCDQLSPKVFRKHADDLLPHIQKWLAADQPYTVRFGIGMLMQHYLDERFDPVYPESVAGVCSAEYYVNMMIAWYFATALAKQYDAVIPYMKEARLDVWTHNKAIQKCLESRRISPERKAYLKSLKINRKDDLREQVDRIRYYEVILCQAQKALKKGQANAIGAALAGKIRELSAYYGSSEWKKDFAADEAGMLPPDLKRGVLSEDGVYNVLQQFDECHTKHIR